MRASHTLWGLVICGLVASTAFAQDGKDKSSSKLKEYKIQDITLKLPETWKEQPPENRLRLAQFVVPAAEGESEETVLVVSSFAGGGAKQNMPRWLAEFKEAPKVVTKKGDSPQGPYELAELTGLHVGPSFRPRKTPLENAKSITLVLMPKDKPFYYLKLTGPAKSVEPAAKALRTAIGANIEKEEDVKLD